MNLESTFAGYRLANPLIVGASPLTASLDMVRRLEDAGASALVLPSLFEEQLVQEQIATMHAMEYPSEAIGEATSFLAEPAGLSLGSERYLAHLMAASEAVDIPVFGSLNGTTRGGWIDHARLIESAGAAGLELNLFNAATSVHRSAAQIENETIQLVKEITRRVQIPVVLKLSPFYSSLPHLAKALIDAGAAGLVLFNRLYQPEIDPEQLEIKREHVADPTELTLRLHWVGVLYDQVGGSMAVTGGVRTARDVVKATMAGADAVQLVTTLLACGPDHVAQMLGELATWLQENEYESLEQMRGSMSLSRCPDPQVYKRDNYMQLLQSWPETLRWGA